MTERRLFLTQTLLLALVALVHVVALQLHLYWHFWWLDIFVHFGGGLWVALAVSWLLLFARREPRIIALICTAIVIGILWEIFEVLIGMTFEDKYVFDTTIDLLMDTAGGIAGYFLTARLRERDTIIPHEDTQSNAS